jgi:succinate-acetate transporter protein
MSLSEEAPAAAAVRAPADPRLSGDPAMIGVPTFVVGSIALGLGLVGFVPAAAVGAPIAIILFATGIGQIISAFWAASIGQTAVAGIFGIFAGFWLSYAGLVLGLVNGWYGVTTTDMTSVQGLFLLSWFILVLALLVGTLRLPMAFSLLFLLIDLALLLVMLGTLNGSTTLLTAGGYVVLAFALIGVYLFVNTASQATGGKGLPLGGPILR